MCFAANKKGYTGSDKYDGMYKEKQPCSESFIDGTYSSY